MLEVDDVFDAANREKKKFRQVAFQQVKGKTFIKHVEIEVNGDGDMRVLQGGRFLWRGTLSMAKEAVEVFNAEVKRLNSRG